MDQAFGFVHHDISLYLISFTVPLLAAKFTGASVRAMLVS